MINGYIIVHFYYKPVNIQNNYDRIIPNICKDMPDHLYATLKPHLTWKLQT